jgi:hypothetical protein
LKEEAKMVWKKGREQSSDREEQASNSEWHWIWKAGEKWGREADQIGVLSIVTLSMPEEKILNLLP